MKYYSIFILFFFLLGCASENPDLVNPPSPSKTVKIRFFNLAGDNEKRTILLNGLVESSLTGNGELSDTLIPPPTDSITVSVKLNSEEEYKYPYKMRLVRDTKYILIGLPSAKGVQPEKKLDTLLSLSTTSGMSYNPGKAYLTMVNTIPDTNLSFTLTLGCPNGEIIAQGIRYKMISYIKEVPAETIPISLLLFDGINSKIIGLYKLELNQNGEYAIILRKDVQDSIKVLVIDQNNLTKSALSLVSKENQTYTRIRPINFSTEKISIIKEPGDVIAQSLNSSMTGKYVNAGACISQSLDTMSVYVENQKKASITTSLDVLVNNSILVFDSAQKKASSVFFIKPAKSFEQLTGKSLVRIVNANYLRTGLTISLGARDDTSSKGFRMGDILASKLSYGDVSIPAVIPSGRAPITIFTSSQPANLIKTIIGNFESGKKYLLAIYIDDKGKEVASLIEEDTEDSKIDLLDNGVFTQIINCNPWIESLSFKIDNILNLAHLNYGSSLSTVLPSGISDFDINGNKYQFNGDLKKRGLIIISGNQNQTDIFDFSTFPFEPKINNYTRRFINASKDMPLISFRIDSDSGFTVADAIEYGKSSNPEIVLSDRKLSFFVIDYKKNKTISRIDDLLFTFGKNFTIIFSGDSTKKGYSLIVQQEY